MKSRQNREPGGDAQFPDRLQTERLRQGYTFEELSAICGGEPTAQTISNWERGTRRPRQDKGLRNVAYALRTTVLFLLYGEE